MFLVLHIFSCLGALLYIRTTVEQLNCRETNIKLKEWKTGVCNYLSYAYIALLVRDRSYLQGGEVSLLSV